MNRFGILIVLSALFYVIQCDESHVQVSEREDRAAFNTDSYLEKFGYLDDKQEGAQHSEDSRRQAIREFQQMAGLRVTGELNKATVRKMKMPRCGLPDVIKPRDRIAPDAGKEKSSDLKRNKPLQFTAAGLKWDKSRITYKFNGYTRKLSEGDIRRSIRNALSKWEAVSPLRFSELARTSRTDADIMIDFVRYTHGDGSSFDGRGGTLAHAFFPGESALSGDTHFDDDEEWTVRSEDGTNLEIVAAHEFGHALGLGHSSVRGALMAPFYAGYDPNYGLHDDDRRGMQSLYRDMRPPDNVTPRPTARPRPRTTQRRPRPTRKPRPTENPYDICSLKIDDIANGPDGHLYIFRGRKAYKFNSNGVGIERGFPKQTRKVFQKGPSWIGAAVYDRRRRKFYFFKGSRYWRYTGFNLDSGYPKRLKGWYVGLQAALQEDNGEIRVLKGSQMSAWREDFVTPPPGYPIDIKARWTGLRSDLEGAVRYRRSSFFFKGLNYFKWDDYRRKVAYRKAKAGPWMGCGRIEPK